MHHIKNIIFDLGGVILNIDFKKTNEAYHRLGIENFGQHINQFHITDLFLQYETGQIDDTEFIESVAKLSDKPIAPHEIVQAWNALLLDFPPDRIRLLRELRTRYRTFLLSNTNSIHLAEFDQRLYDQEGVRLGDLFEKTYYSHVVKLRKPGADIFNLVLNENNLLPGETLFIDDTETNFSEALKLGIQIHHLKPGTSITDIPMFKEKSNTIS